MNSTHSRQQSNIFLETVNIYFQARPFLSSICIRFTHNLQLWRIAGSNHQDCQFHLVHLAEVMSSRLCQQRADSFNAITKCVLFLLAHLFEADLLERKRWDYDLSGSSGWDWIIIWTIIWIWASGTSHCCCHAMKRCSESYQIRNDLESACSP